MKLGRLVKVTWLDAWQDGTEMRAHEFEAECVIETVGWLVRDEPNIVSVAPERLSDGRYRATTHIPRAVVRSLKRV